MAQSLIGALRVNLGLDSANYSRGAKKVQTTTEKMGRDLQKLGAAMSVVGAGITLAIRGQIKEVDRLAKTSQQIGIPVEALSQLRHVAHLSGISMSELETGVQRLSRNMVDSAGKFADLGISIRDANGEMRPTVDVMADVSDLFARMPDGAEKTALAMDLMGRSGAQMIPLLNQGGDALRAMMEEADRLGLTITDETAQAVQNFNDNMTRLGDQMSGIALIVTSELAPVLEKISDVVVDAAKAFQDLSPEMRQLATFLAVAGVVAGPLLIALGTMVLAFKAISAPVIIAIGLIGGIIALMVAFWPEIKAVTGALIDMVKHGIEKTKEAIDSAITFIVDLKDKFVDLAQTGVLLVKTAFQTLVGDGINSTLEAFKGMYSAITELRDRFKDLAIAGVQMVKDKFLEMINFITDLPGQMKQAGADLMSGLAEGITGAAGRARDAVSGAATGLMDRTKSAFGIQSPSKVFEGYGRDLMEGLAIGIEDGEGVATDAMERVGDSLNSVAQTSFASIKDTVQMTIEDSFMGIIDGSKSASEAFKSMVNDILNQAIRMMVIRPLLGSLFGGFGGGASVGAFANGTPFAPGGLALVGERGPELVNLPRGSKVMDAQRTKMAGNGGVQINIKNEAGGAGYQATAQARQNTDGGLNIDVLVRRVVAADISSNGQLSQQMASTFGLRRNI